MTQVAPRTPADGLQVLAHSARRFWWVIVPCVALALISSMLVYRGTPNQYDSSAQLFVSLPTETSAQANYQGGLFTQQRVISYADLVTSPKVLDPVVASNDLGVSRSELASRITTSVPENTVLINIRIRMDSPELAQRATAAVSEQFARFVTALERSPRSSSSPIRIEISRPAERPKAPASPNRNVHIAIGLLGGLLVGGAIAVLLFVRDRTVKSLDGLDQLAGVLPLAAIPEDKANATSTDGHRAEAYRQVRAQLRFINVDSPARVILVTSPSAADGKTSTALGIATAAAQPGVRVLLLEADLRKPTVGQRIEATGTPGLAAYLGDAECDGAPPIVERGDVSYLLAGAAVPFAGEALASQRMMDLVGRLREEFDLIVIDSAPALPVADAVNLAPLADAVIVVARYASTTYVALGEVVRRLTTTGAPSIGVVVNGAPPSKAYGTYGVYGHAATADAR